MLKILPCGVNWLYPEDQVRSSELSVPMHVYLGAKDEVQILGVDGSNLRNKHFAVCKRTDVISVSDYKDLFH